MKWTALALLASSVGGAAPGTASAQSVIQVKAPNVMLLLDTSGSMQLAMDGTELDETTCFDSPAPDGVSSSPNKKTRWMVLAEVLTGTINNGQCGRVSEGDEDEPERWVPLSSNRCVPAVNDHAPILAALASDPASWPTRGGSPERRHPIVFRDDYDCRDAECDLQNGGGTCNLGPGGWDQAGDGLIDSFNNQLRFGLMTFDVQTHADPGYKCVNFDNPSNWVHEAGPYGTGYGAGFGPRFPAWEGPHWGKPSSPNEGLQLWRQTYSWNAYRNAGGRSWPISQGFTTTNDSDDWPYWTVWRNNWFSNDYSYWHASTAQNWTNGSRNYASTPGPNRYCFWLRGSTGSPSSFGTRCWNSTQCVLDNPAACTGPGDECYCFGGVPLGNVTNNFCGKVVNHDAFDVGARNSEAPPWMGRMIGFDANLAETVAQRREHNSMVELAVLGSGPYAPATPLAAMLRDAKEFVLEDTTSRGAYLPNETPVKIGPSNDTDFTGTPRCRESHIVLVSDGEPSGDLPVRASTFAADLAAREVNTYVVGVGFQQIRYDADNNGTLNGSDPTIACNDLRATDLDPGMACEPSGTGNGFVRAASPLNTDQRAALRGCCTLLEIAVAGGTDRAYFPTSQAELKGQFAEVLAKIAGGTISRTVPVFAPSFPTAIAAKPNFSTFYELRSSMEVSGDGGPWVGHLERVRYLCDAMTNQPTRQDIEPAVGDVIEATLADETLHPRRFFTVVPSDPDDYNRTLRPNTAAAWCTGCPTNPETLDGLSHTTYARLGTTAGVDELQTLDDFPDAIDAKEDLEDVLGIGGGDRNDCDDALDPQSGLVDRDDCARKVLKWWSGHADPCENSPADCPTRSRSGARALGAIYRSNPVIVPPPLPDSADQTYSNERADGSESFVTSRHGARPTMLYTQTVDGQLHAFAMAKNMFTGTDPYNVDVPEGDNGKNVELWAFAPPIVMRSLFPNLNVHARLLDGPLSTGNVVYRRTLTNLANGVADWRTVLVGSGGFADALGGYYYALDVTDPTAPRFLWQMTRAGNNSLFAEYSAGAAITHITVQRGGTTEVVAVAVLPGGTPTSLPSGTTPRTPKPAWQGIDHEPRDVISDWGSSEEGRSLTFVELATGRIIARLHGKAGDTPVGGANGLDGTVVHEVPFDSPLSGTPAAHPSTPGEPARQIYVGDVDGTLWRVDVRDLDPANWEAEIAWDAYNRLQTENSLKNAWVANGPNRGQRLGPALGTAPSDVQAAVMGQPIQQAPILSVDERGFPVVLFATGDQETFMTASAGMVNFVVAFTDELLDTGRFSPRIDDGVGAGVGSPRAGVNVAFMDGARATGPLSLFDGQLIFSFFDPGAAAGCAVGSGGACAMNYLERVDQVSQRPIQYIDLDGDLDTDTDDICVQLNNEFVFGIAVNQVPSCGVDPVNVNDPWLAGSYTASSRSESQGYQLVLQTGEGGSAGPGGVTGIRHIGLPTPRVSYRVNSWVTALE